MHEDKEDIVEKYEETIDTNASIDGLPCAMGVKHTQFLPRRNVEVFFCLKQWVYREKLDTIISVSGAERIPPIDLKQCVCTPYLTCWKD